MIKAPALFEVAFASDAVSAPATGGEIEKEKSLGAPLFAGLADFDEGGLDFVKGLFGNHWRVHSLVQFALVRENAVVKLATKQIAN